MGLPDDGGANFQLYGNCDDETRKEAD